MAVEHEMTMTGALMILLHSNCYMRSTPSTVGFVGKEESISVFSFSLKNTTISFHVYFFCSLNLWGFLFCLVFTLKQNSLSGCDFFY